MDRVMSYPLHHPAHKIFNQCYQRLQLVSTAPPPPNTHTYLPIPLYHNQTEMSYPLLHPAHKMFNQCYQCLQLVSTAPLPPSPNTHTYLSIPLYQSDRNELPPPSSGPQDVQPAKSASQVCARCCASPHPHPQSHSTTVRQRDELLPPLPCQQSIQFAM